ncbi:phenylalanine--tRNA ligase subunit alpha [Halalkalicoccus sp. NIPERK01]|uniref:phenylalanine--tRNA ligase subunit alpha n=1 Tax=Halalkalicoccus sp. NIPERK01 TaxID=3053469 RepID=UPI00256EF9E3|nr:phenylalanine--tRNA ligase subunit alpha [Halalkalicoccus sp. NIPERK01]MDL5360440.1 phenylalanine--tRNA ligase subunit alpha [Halalkalicoccus sp. NIPERK01]
MRLPSTQAALLEAASATEERTIERLAEELGEKPETVTGAAFALEEEGLLDVSEEEIEGVSLTEEGAEYAEKGLPERRLYEAALELGADEEPVPMGEAIGKSGLEGGEVDIALSNYARKGYGEIDSGELSAAAGHDEDEEADALALIDAEEPVADAVLDSLERRDLIGRRESTVRSVTLTDEGVTALMEGVEVSETVGQITPEMLTSGEWKDVEFAAYNVEADAAEVTGGKKHVLRQTADRVKDVLVGMGFEEMDGPHVDSEFWINDALFMPQDHPARTHWDQFALETPDRMDDLPEDLVERVRSAHLEGVGEDGEGYHSPWTEEVARGMDLRGHTTSLSMRYLSGEAVGKLEPPQRYFSVEKVYRNDTLDPTHLLEFFQIEGWVMAEDLSVRDLKGTFTEFYERFGITDLQFKPHYNPYTEPSFELFGHHPETGELIEIGNSGMFRPEVLEPLGVECDVMAWGLALERLAMLITGAEDIRDLHGTLADIEFLRNAEVIY